MSPKYVMYMLPLIIIWIYDNIQKDRNKEKINIFLTLILIGVSIFNLKNFPIKSPPTAKALEIVINNNGKYIFSSENDVFKNYIKTKTIFIQNRLILLDNKKILEIQNINEIWFICLNHPSFAYGDYELSDEKKCLENFIPFNYKINRFIHIKDFIIKSYIKI
jgi:hypothetical protein